MTIQELFGLMDFAEESFIVWILYLPFILLVKVPGFYVVASLFIIWQGIRTALHKKCWMPNMIKKKHVSGDQFAHYVSYTIRFLKKLEKIAHPRGTVYQQHPRVLTFNGCMMVLGGCFLLFPAGTYLAPALGVLLLFIGMLEEDILWMVCAYAAFAIHTAHLITLLILQNP